MTEPAALPLDYTDPHLPPGVRDVLARAGEGWLKNTEVCDLLVHYRTYGLPICRHPPSRPAGGSVFLFDRRAVRFFRKDGHSWRKKADGKTVRETHEKLKVGNVDMLNCYYAHGDESEDVRLQRRCYWLLEADEDIVLVHYLSAGQMTGGPRSKGPGARAALSRSTSDEPEASDTTRTTSSDGSAGHRHSLESPFLAKARMANAQSQAAIAAAIASRDAASGAAAPAHPDGGGGSPPMPAPPPHIGPSLRPRNRDGTTQMPPPQLQSPLAARPNAIAAAATRHLGYSTSLSKSSMLIEGQMPLLPTMSTDSFFNLVESLPTTTPGSDAPDGGQLSTRGSMQRQSSGPLRIGSMMNAWDEETAIAPHGHIPSLQLNASALQNNSMMMDAGELDPVGLAGSSLRLPSGFAAPDGYAQFLRGAAHATRMHAPGLRSMSGGLPRMQVVTNPEPGGGADFENNRTFTVRPTTPLYGGEDSPAGAGLPRMTATEHAQGGWDPTAQPGPWESLPSAGDVPIPLLPRAAGLVVHQGGLHPQQPMMAPAPSYTPFSQGGPQQQLQQLMPLGRGQLAAQQAGSGTTLASDISATTGMPPQISSALRRQGSDAAGPHAQPQVPAAAAWVPDSGAEDVGGSKSAAARRGGGAAAVEAELDALQRGMLAAWQGRQPTLTPLGAQVPGWQGQLEGIEARVQAAALPPQRSSTAPLRGPGQHSPGAEGAAQPAFRVTDYAPDWDSTSGGAKLLLTGSLLPGAPLSAQRGPLFLLFDQTEVPATVLQPGVLRATVPPHAPGPVRIAVSLGDGIPRSRLLSFEYRVPAQAQLSEEDRSAVSVSDKELQLRLVQMLLSGRGVGSSSEPASPDEPGQAMGGGDSRQQQRGVQSGLAAEAAPAALPHEQRDRYLTLLLQREVQRYAAQAASGSGSLDALSPSGVGLLHLFAALGYEWGVTAVLLAGAAVDLRDAQGRTALHWAAARGHEAAVTVLLARKASPAARTWPSAGGQPLTPADMAAASGRAGLAAFLAEAQLNQLLVGLKADSRRQALAATAAAAEREPDAAGQRKRTRAERSLYPGEELGSAQGGNPQADGTSALERARRSVAALSDAYAKLAERKAMLRQRREEQRQRDAAAVQRIEQWEAVWQNAEGHTVGATAAAVQRFNALVAQASQLGATLRATLLADHEIDAHEEAAEAGGSDLASSPDCQAALDQAAAYVSAIDTSAEVATGYDRMAAALAAAAAGDTAAKVRRSLEMDRQPSQSLGLGSLKLEGSPALSPFAQPAPV